MKRILLICFSACAMALPAQNDLRGNISLSVVDEEGKPVPDVSLKLLNSADSSLAKIGITDSSGLASMEEIKFGAYFISLTSFEFKTQLTALFSIDSIRPNIQLPVIRLVKAETSLAEVSIVSKKPFIERQLDKLVLNIESSITATGSSVLEVLERAPGVVISNGTAINLKGKSGVRVMIDGKPSPLSGEDLINYLKTIPSANVEKIEIITNPSARYDAAGNAGIINIKFKKDQRQGFNGNLSLSDGQGMYNKPNIGTNLNFRKKKWNVFANYSYGQPTGFTRFYINRKFFDENHSVISVFDQSSFIKQSFKTNNAKLGVDFYASPKTVVGVMFNANVFSMKRDGYTNAEITNSEDVLQYTSGTGNILDEKRFNGFGNFNLKHTFDSTGKELTVDVDYGRFNSDLGQRFSSIFYDAYHQPFAGNELKTEQSGNITVQSAKADYLHPLKKNAKVEAGIKSGYVKTDNDIGFFNIVDNNPVADSTLSNHFIYQEYINAAYLNYARQFSKMDLQLGLRAEHTHTNGKQLSTGEVFERSYLYFFPSVFLNRKLSEKHQLSLSYSRRIDRPNYQQLNPFRIFVDPYTYVVGDPQLKPVLTHSAEFAHTFKDQYITSIGYTHSREAITDVFIQDDSTRISYQVPANLQNYDQYYMSISIPLSKGQWYNANFIASGYYNKYTSKFLGGNLVNANFSFDVNMTNSFVLGKKGWAAELSAYYQGQQAWGLFVIKNLAQVTAGIQKTSKNKMTTFKLSVSDIFYTNRIAVVVQYQNQDFHTSRTWDSRVLTFSFIQRFGKNTVTQARRRNTGVEDEKRRAN